MDSDNHVAPPGCVWVCTACGKQSRDRYGRQVLHLGWDVSCVLHAVLCREEFLVLDAATGKVVEIKEGGIAAL